jgi:hypothetical protein
MLHGVFFQFIMIYTVQYVKPIPLSLWLQTWFNNKRAEHRKSLREAMLRDALPGTENDIFMMDMEEL